MAECVTSANTPAVPCALIQRGRDKMVNNFSLQINHPPVPHQLSLGEGKPIRLMIKAGKRN